MKKVVYNTCYGGFGLSNKAIHLLAQRKGITLNWYVSTTGWEPPYKLITPEEAFSRTDNWSVRPSITECTGDVIHDIKHYSLPYEDDFRSDPDLVAVVEELGAEANTRFSELMIEEIPDLAEYEIDEYDGMESVVPPRQSW